MPLVVSARAAAFSHQRTCSMVRVSRWDAINNCLLQRMLLLLLLWQGARENSLPGDHVLPGGKEGQRLQPRSLADRSAQAAALQPLSTSRAELLGVQVRAGGSVQPAQGPGERCLAPCAAGRWPTASRGALTQALQALAGGRAVPTWPL